MTLEDFYEPRFIEWLIETKGQLEVELEVQTIFAKNWLKYYLYKQKGASKQSYQPHFKTDISKCFVCHLKMKTIVTSL